MVAATIALVGCATPTLATTAPSQIPSPTIQPSATATQTHTPTVTNTPAPTSAPTITPTPNPFAGYTIPELAARSYGGTDLYIVGEVEQAAGFTRYQVEWISDGIVVTGLMNIPIGEGPFPVIIANHGYIDPAVYVPGLDSRPMGDFFAQHGYATIMPDYRGYAGSDDGPNPMRIGYAMDVMNLVEMLHLIINLDPERVGVVGHSMGGGVSTYVMVLSDRVDAVSLYGSMSADQAANWQHIHDMWSPGGMEVVARTYGAPQENPEGYASISPINYLNLVSMPVNIHHGTLDDQVPIAWSVDLANRLSAAGAETTLYTYPDAGHTFRNPEMTTFLLRDLEFFDRYVKGEPSG
jgi:dipeptidyl aminopeptidase/acylaminoacyl peptidase